MSDDPVVHPYRWALIGALVLCSLALVWYGFTIGVMLPDISEDLGLRPAEEGWLSSSFYLGQLVLTLPVTAWLTRYNPLRSMGLVYAATVALLVAAALTPWYWGEVGIRFALAFAFVALNPVRTLIIAGWFRRDEVARVMSVFNSGFGVIQTIAFWSSGLLLTALGGWRALVWLLAGLAALSTAAWYLVARFAPPPVAPPLAAGPRRGGSMARVLHHKQVWLLCLVGTGGGLTWATYLTFWPSFAQDDLGLSKGTTGVVLGCAALTIIPGSLMAAWVVDRVGSRRLFLIIATLSQVAAVRALGGAGESRGADRHRARAGSELDLLPHHAERALRARGLRPERHSARDRHVLRCQRGGAHTRTGSVGHGRRAGLATGRTARGSAPPRALHSWRAVPGRFASARSSIGGAGRGRREVKQTGNGMMAAFGSAADAVNCALQVRSHIETYNDTHAGGW